MKFFRLIIAGAVVVIGGGVVAVSTAYTWMFGEGEIHVIAHTDDVTVLMDGEPLGEVSAMTTGRFFVSQGGHKLTLTSTPDVDGEADGAAATPQTSEVDVSVGGWTEVIVSAPGLCVADLDVTDGIYNSSEPNWSLKKWYGAGELVDMPSNGGTSFADLPDEIDQFDRARLVVAVPCEQEGQTEAINATAQLRMLLETTD